MVSPASGMDNATDTGILTRQCAGLGGARPGRHVLEDLGLANLPLSP